MPDFPTLYIVLAVFFVLLVLWANRCSKCGKFFTSGISSRTKTSEGYRTSWKSEKNSSRTKLVREYKYEYNETHICRHCGHQYSTSTSSSRALSCGHFAPGAPQAHGCLNPLYWYKLIPGKKYILTLLLLLLGSIIIFDPEVIFYPTHFFDYAENFIEFLEDPFSPPYCRRVQLEIVEGNWETRRFVQEYRKVERETWSEYVPKNATIIHKKTKMRPIEGNPLSIKNIGGPKPGTWVKYSVDTWASVSSEVATGTGPGVTYPGELLVPPGEVQYGAKKSNSTTAKYWITFKETNSGKTFQVEKVGFIRNSDLAKTRPHQIGKSTYMHLLEGSKSVKARVYAFHSISIKPDVYIYVDKILY